MREIVFRFPNLEENLRSNSIYEEVYEKCIKAGIITKNKIMVYLSKYEILTPDMQKQMDNIEGGDFFKYPSIPNFEDKTDENRFIEKAVVEVITGERKIQVTDLLKSEEDERSKIPEYQEYRVLSSAKSTHMRHTAEALADQARMQYLMWTCSYDAETKNRIWESFEQFKKSRNKLLILALTSKFTDFVAGLNQTIIRKISRHALWRTKWISATKTGAPIFRGYVAEWDTNKSFLCYWSNFLDNIYSSVEPPEEFIVNDDRLLDAWVEAKFREHKKGTSSNSNEEGVRAVFKTKVNPIAKRK